MEIKEFVVCVMLLVGFSFFAVAMLVLSMLRRFRASGVRTRGVVVDIRRSGKTRVPVVEYETAGGKQRARGMFGNNGIHTYVKGSTIDIIYDKNKPGRFIVEGDRTPAFLTTLFLVLGLIVVAIAPLMYFIIL